MTAGRGRPLILTVLEPDEAMRILAGGDADRTRLAAGLLGAGAILIAGACLWAAVTAILPAIVDRRSRTRRAWSRRARGLARAERRRRGGDPRSNGQGPGLVGTPGLAILGVSDRRRRDRARDHVLTLDVRLTARRAGSRPAAPPSPLGDASAGDRRRRGPRFTSPAQAVTDRPDHLQSSENRPLVRSGYWQEL